jgi:GSCFA family
MLPNESHEADLQLCRGPVASEPVSAPQAVRLELEGQSHNAALDLIKFERGGRQATFNGSWYRGAHTNFIPCKTELREPDAVDKYILAGWLPPKPFIDRQAPITAFGSCFAMHISDHLASAGYNVYGRHLGLDAHIIRFGEGMVNTFAIRQQFEWALREREFPENLWFGAHKEIAAVDPAIRAQTYEIMRATRVFIITLGLSEIWYDKTSGDAFWRAIPAHLFDERIHGFRLSTPAENYDNLAAILGLIRKLRADAKVIFTLSPIPLMATFRPVSCLTANSVSKATLRVAIDQLMRDRPHDEGLHYFPSYEIVTELFTDPREDDNRHVRPELVAFVMETFRRHYCM